jgi:hypothetical protein
VEILRQGSEGPEVQRWQQFLLGFGLLERGVDGIFGPFTDRATRAYQRRKRIVVDGVVGPITYGAALRDGFDPGFTDPRGGTSGADWPPRPLFAPLVSNAEREAIYGRFRYERVTRGKDDIRVLDDWADRHLTTIAIPQLRGVEGASASGRVRLHKKVAEQTRELFARWEQRGLNRLVLTWAGMYAARFERGSPTRLSSHAWGAGFDINAAWNGLGRLPALRGERGSVRELVEDANTLGFFWGGHFVRRSDGMHFEVARPLG